jgi:parallel beta-helix repeat protein
MKHRKPGKVLPLYKAHRSDKRKTLALVGGLLAVAVGVPSGLVVAAAGGSSAATVTTRVVNDTFNRTVVSGLGKADLGGTYSLASTAVPVSVKPGSAIVSVIKPGQSAGAWLPSSVIKDTQAQVSISIPQITSANIGLYFGLESRRQSDGRSYRGKVSVGAGGKLALAISRTALHGVETSLGYYPLPFKIVSGQLLNIQTLVTGSSPTKIQVRAWQAGVAVPAWQLTATDSSASQIKTAGSIGEWAFVSSSGSQTGFSLKNLQGWSLTQSVATTTSTSTSATPVATTSAAATKVATTTAAPATTTSAASSTSTSTSSAAVTATASATATTAAVATSTSGRGSLAVGTASYAVPAGALFVSPSGSDSAAGTQAAPLKTVQAAVNKATTGKTIVLRAGTYHQTAIVSKTGLTIQAYPNEAVWFDGSSVVSSWTKSGSVWVHSGWTNQFDHSASFSTGTNSSAFINPSYPMAAWPDQVFINGAKLAQVAAGSSVGAGQFSVNYSAKTLTIGSDPTGKEVRSSDLVKALTASATNVTLQGFGVRRYGTPLPQMGTVSLYGGSNTARNLVVSDNATQGISMMHSYNIVDHVTSTGNGMTGIHGNQADGSVIKNSFISGNNAEHFNASPSAAGMKITRTLGFTISNNTVTNNLATGIWLDESVRRFTIANNTSTGNKKGITIELSDTGIVANNVLTGEYGLWALDSGNIKVFNNSFSGVTNKAVGLSQDARRQAASGAVGRDPRMPVPDPTCPWLTRNITVANNQFAKGGSYQVFALDQQTNISADQMNLVINGNFFAYKDTSTDASMVAWGGSDNHSVTLYQTPAALAAAKNATWKNAQATPVGSKTPLLLSTVESTIAVPLPSDVAAVIGVASGTRSVGTF